MVHHDSRTGLSLLPDAAWKYYLVHGNKSLLRKLYPAIKRNVLWWIDDRDSDGDGVFQIAHQYETGMDDLHRWGPQSMSWRYDAVDATTYALLNLRAVANMARVLGEAKDAAFLNDYADKCAAAITTKLWHDGSQSWRDRHPQTHELADILGVTTFYPFLTSAPLQNQLSVLRNHLLNSNEFWLPHPVPALAKNQPDFNPEGFWQGPSWPAATTHIVEGFATTAKRMDRALLPKAGELFRRAAANHLQPRADFYERYNPVTGKPLSKFRDYMHSWWIDLFVRHVAGLMLEDDGSVHIDALPVGLDHFALENVRLRGKRLDVLWAADAGLTVRIDGKVVSREVQYRPGNPPVMVRALRYP
jgi:glycogen debranching enzyme